MDFILFIFFKILSFITKMYTRGWAKFNQIQLRRVGVASNVEIKGRCRFSISRDSTITIRNNVTIASEFRSTISNGILTEICVQPKAYLYIGENSGISSTSIHVWESVYIGSYVNIGAGCLIMDTNFHSLESKIRMTKEGGIPGSEVKTSPIVISDHVFVGARSIICKGVNIGENSIVATGSVVVKNIPANQIWGGNPAKFISEISK